MTLKLGVIGLSDGNGHPYSWSAIMNGYDVESMNSCEFPAIPAYLAQQSWPSARLKGASVEWVWTQDIALSKKVARASLIPHVANQIEDMLPEVDALLLARDDAENHLQYAKPFLQAGKPVYIDKPIALSLVDLDRLYELQQYPGQIFSCSALRYSDEMRLTRADRERLGEILEIHAVTPKSWDKYAVHIVEPVLRILGGQIVPCRMLSDQRGSAASLTVEYSSGMKVRFFALGDALSPLVIRLYGTQDYKELVFTDSFNAFKAALKEFVEGIKTNTTRSSYEHLRRVVTLIEAGRKI